MPPSRALAPRGVAVAIKEVPKDTDARRAQYLREVDIHLDVRHRNVVEMVEPGVFELANVDCAARPTGWSYLVMRFFEIGEL